MMMLIVALLIGISLGMVFLGGLWLTVLCLPTSRHPALLLLGSFVVRMGIVLFGFYLVMGGHWERLIACTAGFIVARLLIVRYVATSNGEPQTASPQPRIGGPAK